MVKSQGEAWALDQFPAPGGVVQAEGVPCTMRVPWAHSAHSVRSCAVSWADALGECLARVRV